MSVQGRGILVDDHEPTARLQDPTKFVDHAIDRPDMLENLDRDDRVERTIGKWQATRRSLDAVEPSSFGQHCRRDIEPNDSCACLDEVRREPSLAAAEIENQRTIDRSEGRQQSAKANILGGHFGLEPGFLSIKAGGDDGVVGGDHIDLPATD
jgi:hypothetical protein